MRIVFSNKFIFHIDYNKTELMILFALYNQSDATLGYHLAQRTTYISLEIIQNDTRLYPLEENIVRSASN